MPADISGTDLPIRLRVEIEFADYQQSFKEAQRLLVRKQRQAPATGSVTTLTLAIAALIGAGLYIFLPRALTLDQYAIIRPPAYVTLSLGLPLVMVGLFSLAHMASVSGLWRAAGWLLVLIMSVGVVVLLQSRRAAQALPGPDPDWFGTLFPHTAWIVLMLFLSWAAIHHGRRSQRILWESQQRLLRPKQVTLHRDGVTVEEPDERVWHGWPAICRFSETKDALLVWVSDVSFHILPKRCFTSEQELEAARQLFLDNVTDAEQIPKAFEVVPARSSAD